MYDMNPIVGTSLPPMTLCLTFDDGPGETPGSGPGPHTLMLAEYLSQQGVRGTFFMAGKHAEQFSSLLPQIRDLGHLVANHSYNHPDLVDLLDGGGDVIDQVARTDVLIRNWVDEPTIFFRPPYGGWSDEVALALNSNLAVSMGHVGPILWDIDGDVLANGPGVGAWEPLDLIPVGPHNVAFRTVTGHFLTRDEAGVLKANVTWLRAWEIFEFQQA